MDAHSIYLEQAMRAGLLGYSIADHNPEDTENLILFAFTEKELALLSIALTVYTDKAKGTNFFKDSREIYLGILDKVHEIMSEKARQTLEDEG